MKQFKSWAIFLWALAFISALAVRYLQWENLWATSWEGILILIAVLIFLSIKPVYLFITLLPPFYRTFLAVFFTASLFSQFSEINNVVFPFTSWQMYAVTDKSQMTHFLQYEGVTVSGKRIELNLPHDFPLLQKVLNYQIEYLGSIFGPQPETLRPAGETKSFWKQTAQKMRLFFAEYPPLDNHEKEARLKALFAITARRHNQSHREDQLKAVEVIFGTVDLGQLPHPPTERKTVARYEMTPEGGLL